jgi:hypothetical protein
VSAASPAFKYLIHIESRRTWESGAQSEQETSNRKIVFRYAASDQKRKQSAQDSGKCPAVLRDVYYPPFFTERLNFTKGRPCFYSFPIVWVVLARSLFQLYLLYFCCCFWMYSDIPLALHLKLMERKRTIQRFFKRLPEVWQRMTKAAHSIA